MKLKLVVMLVGLMTLVGCAGLTPVTPNDSSTAPIVSALKDVSTQLKATQQSLADTKVAMTQPAAPGVAAPPANVTKPLTDALDKADAALDKASTIASQAATVSQKLSDAVTSQASTIDKLQAVAVAGAQAIHQTAPGTSADLYAGLAVTAVTLLAGLGKILDHKKAQAATTALANSAPVQGPAVRTP